MKKFFLFLAAACCCMMVNADPTFTITYTPKGGTEQTITEGTTHDLGDLKGAITISGTTITFDNVVAELERGFLITPSDLNTNYALDLQFTGYNVVSADLTPTIDVVGNASRVNLKGDALRAYGHQAPALRTANGYFRAGMLELYAYEASMHYFVIEMGAGQKLDILADESYGRVCLDRAHHNLEPLILPPLTNGASVIDEKSTDGRIFYGTNTMMQTVPATIAGFTLNQGNLPYVTRILPGYKSGTFSVEDKSNREGSFVHFNMKDLEMVSNRQEIFKVTNANLMLNVEGTNSITGGSLIFESQDLEWEGGYGQIEVKGVGQNAQLTVTSIDNIFPAIFSMGYIRFDNLTAKVIMDPADGTYCKLSTIQIGGQDEPYIRQLLINKTAKLMLRQKHSSNLTPGLVNGIKNLGDASTSRYANPVDGAFVDGQLVDVNNTPLHEAFFDTEVYEGLIVEGWMVCSLSADDVIRDGKVSYDAATNTLILNHGGLEALDVTAPMTGLNITATNNSWVAITNAPSINIINSSDLIIYEASVGELTITNSEVVFEECVFSGLTAVPTFVGCHAVEYSEFSLQDGVLYGKKNGTDELVENMTVVKDDPEGIRTAASVAPASKSLRDGQIVILRAGKSYSIHGIEL